MSPRAKRSTNPGPNPTVTKAGGCIYFSPAFSADGSALAAIIFDETVPGGATEKANRLICQWDVATGKLAGRIKVERGGLQRLLMAADGRTLVTADTHGSIVGWEIASGTERFRLNCKAAHIMLSPDGQVLAWSKSNEPAVYLTHLVTGNEMGRLPGRVGATVRLRFAPDGRALSPVVGKEAP